MSQKEADIYNKKNEDKEDNESSPLQGDNKGNYGGLDLKRRNNIRF